MGQFILWSEVPGFTAEDDWRIEDAEAKALLAAPCLSGALSAEQSAGLRAILREALMRWKDVGTGAVTQQQAGPWMQSIDTTKQRRGMFWPSELDELRSLCRTASSATAGTTSTLPASSTAIHQPWCSLMLGATYCSCGADIAGTPLWEL